MGVDSIIPNFGKRVKKDVDWAMVDTATRMMWLSQNTKLSFDDRLREALKYYQKKYGVASLCFVHSSMLVNGMGDEKPIEVDGIEVKTLREVMPNHFWIGN